MHDVLAGQVAIGAENPINGRAGLSELNVATITAKKELFKRLVLLHGALPQALRRLHLLRLRRRVQSGAHVLDLNAVVVVLVFRALRVASSQGSCGPSHPPRRDVNTANGA